MVFTIYKIENTIFLMCKTVFTKCIHSFINDVTLKILSLQLVNNKLIHVYDS